jgi:formylglycine-generating enzyme required for sulfatase activity
MEGASSMNNRITGLLIVVLVSTILQSCPDQSVSTTTNKDALYHAISEANTLNDSHIVGTAVGNVSQSAKNAFTATILAATAVASSSRADQSQVDLTVAELTAATAAFTDAIIQVGDKTELTRKISDATAWMNAHTVGLAVGNVSQEAQDTFGAEISSATVVRDSDTVNQDQVDTAVTTLELATTTFNAAIISMGDKAALTEAITNAIAYNSAHSVGTAPGNVSQAAKDAYITAIMNALLVQGNSNANQSQVDAALSALALATSNFSSACIGQSDLVTAINYANALNNAHSVGTGHGNVSQAAKDAFTSAIQTAIGVRDNSSSTQAQIDSSSAALIAATTVFTRAINVNLLRVALDTANSLNSSHSIGISVGDVSQANKDTYNAAISLGTAIYNDITTVQSQIDEAVSILTAATIAFPKTIMILGLKPVPAGSFQRDANPANISVIKQAFKMGTTEVTRAQFLAVMGEDPSYGACSSGTNPPGTDPVQRINWYHAIAFCNKLSIAECLTPVYAVSGITDWVNLAYSVIPTVQSAAWDATSADWSANGYRLPTEMEWMWAAMGAVNDRSNGYIGIGVNTTGYRKGYAGSTEMYDAQINIGEYAWTNENSDNKTHPVGTKTPNELGLFDMTGNIYEWNWDWADTTNWPAYTISGTIDSNTALGRGGSSGTVRIVHGSTFNYIIAEAILAFRGGLQPYFCHERFGFRVVRY